MKKFLLLMMMCMLLLGCSMIEIMNIEKTADRFEFNCNNQCQSYEKTTDEWCDCMYACMNTGKMKIKLAKCESDSAEVQ